MKLFSKSLLGFSTLALIFTGCNNDGSFSDLGNGAKQVTSGPYLSPASISGTLRSLVDSPPHLMVRNPGSHTYDVLGPINLVSINLIGPNEWEIVLNASAIAEPVAINLDVYQDGQAWKVVPIIPSFNATLVPQFPRIFLPCQTNLVWAIINNGLSDVFPSAIQNGFEFTLNQGSNIIYTGVFNSPNISFKIIPSATGYHLTLGTGRIGPPTADVTAVIRILEGRYRGFRAEATQTVSGFPIEVAAIPGADPTCGGTTPASTLTILAPQEVHVGQSYTISLVDGTGRTVLAPARLVITKNGDTQHPLLDSQLTTGIASWGNTPTAADAHIWLSYTITRGTETFYGGSLVQP